MRRLVAFIITMMALSGSLLRADDKAYPDKPGEWQYTSSRDYAGMFGLTPDQSRAFMAKVDAAASVLRETKVFNPPLGFQARAHGDYVTDHCAGGSCVGKPVQARLQVVFYYFVEDAKGQPAWGGEANTSAELCINDPWHVLSSNYSLWSGGLWLADGREISLEPQPVGQLAGFPLYNLGNDALLVFTRTGTSCWSPVTRRQFLMALITDRAAAYPKESAGQPAAKDPYQVWVSERPTRLKSCEAAYQQMKKIDPAKAEDLRAQFKKMEAEIEANLKASSASTKPDTIDPYRAANEGLRAELAGMTPAESALPAWYLKPEDAGSGLVPPNTLHAVRLVTLNPTFFARSRPTTDIQLISVRFYFGGLSQQNLGGQRLQEFLTTADWQRIGTLVGEHHP